MRIVVSLNENAALFADPESKEAKVQNLILNMMGGLTYEDLTPDEKALLYECGYKGEDKDG